MGAILKNNNKFFFEKNEQGKSNLWADARRTVGVGRGVSGEKESTCST